jgi:hypothetical protein
MGKLKKYGELLFQLSHSSPFFLALHTILVVPFFSFLPSSPYFFSLLKKYGELGRKEKNGTTERVWKARKKGEEWDN